MPCNCLIWPTQLVVGKYAHSLFIQILQLEKESIRQLLIISGLIEENHRLRRHECSLSSEQLEGERNEINGEAIIRDCCDLHCGHKYIEGQITNLKKHQHLVENDGGCLTLQTMSQVCLCTCYCYIHLKHLFGLYILS